MVLLLVMMMKWRRMGRLGDCAVYVHVSPILSSLCVRLVERRECDRSHGSACQTAHNNDDDRTGFPSGLSIRRNEAEIHEINMTMPYDDDDDDDRTCSCGIRVSVRRNVPSISRQNRKKKKKKKKKENEPQNQPRP
jgi:hypothetical protein